MKRSKIGLLILWGIVSFSTFMLSPNVNGQTGLFTSEIKGPKVAVSIEGFSPLIPVLRKWYVPQDLYKLYNWGGWKYSNYAKEHYKRYVSVKLEGTHYYDVFGNYVTRGWKIFDWRQDQPRVFGSSVFKDTYYGSWFDRVLVSSDRLGQYYMALTIGDEIRTTLTPLTFSKPTFNGVQWDFLSDKYKMTLLASRINAPVLQSGGPSLTQQFSDFSNLLAWRGTAQLAGFVNIGATYVNSSLTNSKRDWNQNSFQGSLTTSQNSGNVSMITILISDDSPGDTEGAIFYSEKIFINGKRAAIKPRIEGGIPQNGLLMAIGDETIKLIYDIPDPSIAKKIRFALTLANDYRVDVTSNLQTNASGQPVFLLVTRAEGNVKDNSNQQVVCFDYGLPTGNDIYGLTVKISDFKGFSVQGEYNVNRRFRRFPNINLTKHSLSSDKARAFFLNISKIAYWWYAYAEFFSIDDQYTTFGFIPDNTGLIDYSNDNLYKYEYVEDNDDQDRYPDWRRANQPFDNAVFPGLDENNNRVSDFNENLNLTPDYEEPFLKYDVDPPEFLFGVDMNHNTVIDRFENDKEPDYPYKRDHQGYNIYGGIQISPDIGITLGHLHERLMSSDRRSRSNYALFTLRNDWPRIGRLQVFDNLRLVHDNIPDDLFQWVQTPGTLGGNRPFDDPLLAQDTVINTAYMDFWFIGVPNLNIINKFKYETYHWRKPASGEASNARFVGVINKLDYNFEIGVFKIMPKFKNMYRRKTQRSQDLLELNDFTETIDLIVRFPLLSRSSMAVGFEYEAFFNKVALPAVPPSDYVDDYTNRVFCVQFSNEVDYLGYHLVSKAGLQIQKKQFRTLKQFNTLTTSAFITVYAGVE